MEEKLNRILERKQRGKDQSYEYQKKIEESSGNQGEKGDNDYHPQEYNNVQKGRGRFGCGP